MAGDGGQGHRDGAAAQAQFSYPTGFALLLASRVLVADQSNHRIRVLTADLQQVSTLAGDGEYGHRDGAAAQAQFYFPTGLALLSDGRVLLTDCNNHPIRVPSADLQQGPVETKPEAKPTKHAKFCGAPNDVFIDWRYKDCSLDMKGRPSTAQRQTALRKRWLNQQLAYDKVLIGDLEAKLAKFDKRREARRVKGAAALQNKRDEEAALHRRFNLPTTGWSKTPSAVGSCLGEESVQGKLYPLASVEDTLQGLERSSARDDGGWDAGEEGDDWGGDGAPALDEADAARQAQQASVVLRTIQAKLHGNGAMLRVTDVFREFDRDFSGTIEIDELRAALVSLGVPLEEHDFQLVRPVFDLNGDGVVDYAEFDKIMKRELVRNPRRASQILRAPDADRPYTPESMQNAKGGSWGHASRWEKKAPAPGSAGSDGGELKGFSDASDSGMQHSKGVTAARVTGGTISRAVR